MNQGLKAVDLTSLRNARDLSRQCWKCSRSLIKAFILFYCNTNVLNEYFSLVIYKGLLLNFQKQLLKLSKLLSCLFRVISDMIVTVSKTKLVSIDGMCLFQFIISKGRFSSYFHRDCTPMKMVSHEAANESGIWLGAC